MVEPRIQHAPAVADRALAERGLEFLHQHDFGLDEWQELPIREALSQDAEGRKPLELGICLPRQNGKGEIMLALLLIGVFVEQLPLQIYSAHEFATAMEHFTRLEFLLEERPELYEQLKLNKYRQPMIIRSHGAEGFHFEGNRRILFRTRTKGGGRGFTCDRLIADEAMVFSEMQHAALMPTLSAVPDAQIVYSGSAVDQETHEHGVVFARVRERGIKGEDQRLAFFEWSIGGDYPNPEAVPADVLDDMAALAQANPAMGTRISPDFVAVERRSLSSRSFSVERGGIGDWPRTDYAGETVIAIEDWLELKDGDSVLVDPVYLAFDVSPDRRCALSAAGRNMQGLWHVEVFEARRGTAWLPDRLAELIEKHRPSEVVCDAFGPAGNLVQQLDNLGIAVRAVSATEHGQACARMLDCVEQHTLRHLGSDEMRNAILGAKTRPLGDAWAWSRKNSSVDISPLVASTLALSAAIEAQARSVYEDRGVLAL